MGILQLQSKTTVKFDVEKAKRHVLFTHDGTADGFITIAKKTQNGRFQQYHYKPEQLAEHLSKWLGEDVFFSQNTFYKPLRRIETIRQLRTLYIDLDCYNLDFPADWVLGKLELESFNEELPEPNLVIFSGRGLVLIWLIDPVPYKALPLWQAVQNYFLDKLSDLGADSKSIDAPRIFRMAGSVNTKNGAQVDVEYRHDYRYTLRDIQDEYLPELKPYVHPERKAKRGRPPKVAQLFNIYRLHCTRLKDLVTLVRLRDGAVANYREIILFLYRYWSCCVLKDKEEALKHTLDFNEEFAKPLSEREVITATRSAEKAWDAKNNEEANTIAKLKGFPGAGYNISNEKLIKWLDITEEEQRELDTIIGTHEYNRRKRIRDRQYKREKRGSVTRNKYIATEKEKTEDKLFLLEQAMKKYPNAKGKELAKLLSVTPARISQLKRQLKN